MPGFNELNLLPSVRAFDEFMRCCGCRKWAKRMCDQRPFANEKALFESSDSIWRTLKPRDFLEAFTAHPRIGEASSSRWSRDEQEKSRGSDAGTLAKIKLLQKRYEEKFGYIFIVCATGKGAVEILSFLEKRITHAPAAEIQIAAEEQNKITRIRLRKLLGEVF
jgi:OHCU decarboxylase